ncbi:16268_t:CDS:2, partial [Gigaspora margarita]
MNRDIKDEFKTEGLNQFAIIPVLQEKEIHSEAKWYWRNVKAARLVKNKKRQVVSLQLDLKIEKELRWIFVYKCTLFVSRLEHAFIKLLYNNLQEQVILATFLAKNNKNITKKSKNTKDSKNSKDSKIEATKYDPNIIEHFDVENI